MASYCYRINFYILFFAKHQRVKILMNLSINALLKNKMVWFALFFVMGDAILGIIVNIYSNTIVLSHYPASFLIYFTITQTLFSSFLRMIVAHFVTDNFKKNAILQYAFFIAFFILSILLMKLNAYYLPFIVAVMIGGISALSAITVMNLLALSFGFREFKTLVQYFQQASFLSSIAASFSVPLVVHFYSNSSLLWICIFSLVICLTMIYQLPVQKIDFPRKQANKKKTKPIKLPLFRYMLIFSILVSTICVITQYNLKLSAAKYYTHEQLSSFFGYFLGITSIIGFVFSSTSNWALKKFGLFTIRVATPFLVLILSVIALFFPSFRLIFLLDSIRPIINWSYGNYSDEITLNALPSEMRFLGKAKLKTIARNSATFLLLALTFGNTNVDSIMLLLPPLCLLAIFIGFKISKYYKKTLQQEAAFKRYNLLEEVTPATRPILEEFSLNAIQSKDTSNIFYGLDIIAKLDDHHPPQALFELIHHKEAIVRQQMINFLVQRQIPEALPFLRKQLTREADSQLQLKILAEVLRLDPSAAFPNIQENTEFATLQQALRLFLQPDKKPMAIKMLAELSTNSDPKLREMLAFTIGHFQIKDLEAVLKTLISDANQTVSKEALNAVVKLQTPDFIPDILKLALQNKKNISAQYSLIAFGEAALPELKRVAADLKHRALCAKIMASIPGIEAEKSLLDLIPLNPIILRNQVTKYANLHAWKFLPSDAFKAKAQIFIQQECGIIINLQNKLKTTTRPNLQKEIHLRIIKAKNRFLQYLAIATRPREVNQLIAALLQEHHVDERAMDKAIELLEIIIPDQQTRDYISYVFENTEHKKQLMLSTDYQDDLLERMMTDTDKQTSLVSIIFELRAVRLFANLPSEILLALAEEVQFLHYAAGDLIFSKDDVADGLYCISSGEVSIVRHEKIISTITTHGFFGELALLDDAPRAASAIAKTECSIMFIEKEVSNRIADDVPELLRELSLIILEYARKNLEMFS